MLRLNTTSEDADVLRCVEQSLELVLPWTTHLTGIAGLLTQWIGPQSGVTIYGVLRPEIDLVAVGTAGLVGPLAVGWGLPMAGLAAAELSAQFAGDSRAFADYQGGWLGVHACVAIPIARKARPLAVLEVRSHVADRLEISAAELISKIAARLAEKWPEPPGTTHSN